MKKLLLLAIFAVSLTAYASAQAPAPLNVGDMAPDFTLPGSDGKTYKLSDFRGKQAVVLAWFPGAFTSGCTIECKSLAANGDRIRHFDVTYFMVSVDPMDGDRGNKAFAETYEADFPMLSDASKTVGTAYGVLNARGSANRWTFYIDKQGKIAAIDKMVRPATSAEDMVTRMGELKFAERR